MSLQPVPIQNVPGVPDYTCTAFLPKSSDYCLLIPVINEGSRILTELGRAQKAGVPAAMFLANADPDADLAVRRLKCWLDGQFLRDCKQGSAAGLRE